MKANKRLEEINKRKKEIRELLKNNKDVNLKEIEVELRKLEEEAEEIEKRQAILNEIENVKNGEEIRSLGTVDNIIENNKEKRTEQLNIEQRGKALKEGRTITVNTSKIVLPKHTADNIIPGFNPVSSLIDLVQTKLLQGGESFEQPYEKEIKEGNYTEQGSNYSDVEVVTGYAMITKSKITAYQEEPEEVTRLTAAQYDQLITTGVGKALRIKINKEILIGDGQTNHFRGIFHNPSRTEEQVIDPKTDIEISQITANTLDEIIYSYAGDEETETTGVLILNKNDLKEFATLRDSYDRKVYEVKNNGNTGTINGIPYIISSACKSIKTAAGEEYCMAYGALENYLIAIFNDVEISRSTDFKFKQGIICHRGSMFLGGNVVKHNGFIRVKKANG